MKLSGTFSAANLGLGSSTGKVKISPDYYKGGVVLGFNGLDKNKHQPDTSESFMPNRDSEVVLLCKLIDQIFNKIALEASASVNFMSNNEKTNYVRRKMRFNFCGKCIIQPQDIIHVYMNSKSRFDNKLTSGLRANFEGLSILQNLNNTITDLSDSIKNVFNPSGNLDLQAEKSIFVGSDFDNTLWMGIRDQFVNEIEGTHVFAGIVTTSPISYSGGKYTVSISCDDNSAYLSNGKINFKPGVDVFNRNDL